MAVIAGLWVESEFLQIFASLRGFGQQPEIRDVNGTKVANFSIAVNENYKTKSGEKKENTHWYRCEAWDVLFKPLDAPSSAITQQRWVGRQWQKVGAWCDSSGQAQEYPWGPGGASVVTHGQVTGGPSGYRVPVRTLSTRRGAHTVSTFME